MSWTSWALFGFVVGWLLHACLEPHQKWRRVFAGVIGGLGLLFIALFAAAYLLSPGLAFAWEETVGRSRTLWTLLWLYAGWCTRDHGTAIGSHLKELFDAFLGKRGESPWALQSALAILILFGIFLTLRPNLLDKLISFRAGNVEVNLASSSGKVREATIYSKYPSQINAFKNYSEFDIKDKLPIYQLNLKGDMNKQTITNIQDYWYIKVAAIMVEKHLKPIVQALVCLQSEGHLYDARTGKDLIELVSSLANLIMTQKFSSDDDLGNRIKNVLSKSYYIQNKLFDLADKFKSEVSDARGFKSEVSANKACQTYVDKNKEQKSGAQADVMDIIKEYHKKTENYNEVQEFWEAYTVGIIAELVAFTEGQKQKADLLQKNKLLYSLDITPETLPIPGNISLYYQLVLAKLQSSVVWPFDETFDELHNTLVAIDTIINYSDQKLKDVGADKDAWQQLDTKYRLNHLIVLAATLELINDRALSGAPIKALHRQYWEASYKEIREILSASKKTPTFLNTMNADEKSRWLAASASIDGPVTLDILQNAALSAILIPEQGGRATDADCSAAKSLILSARDSMPVSSQEEDAYSLGIVEQSEERIEITCGK